MALISTVQEFNKGVQSGKGMSPGTVTDLQHTPIGVISHGSFGSVTGVGGCTWIGNDASRMNQIVLLSDLSDS